MSLSIQSLFDSLQTQLLVLGVLDDVNTHEPKNAPGNGITGALWFQNVTPDKTGSGLNVTSARVEFMLRLYTNMLMKPEDAIDPNMVDATDTIMSRLSNHFTLDGLVKKVDLLGSTGTPLQAQAGYVESNGKLYRCIDITIPLIVNDVWTQEA